MIPRRLVLTAWDPKINGSGSSLEIEVTAMQDTRGRAGRPGRTHRATVLLKVDRVFVKRLAEQVAQMQERDRDRIRWELERLNTEIAPLLAKGTT